MPFAAYLLATGFGIIPVVVVYTVFASSLIAGAGGKGHAFITAMLAAVVLVLVTFLPRLAKRATGRARDSR